MTESHHELHNDSHSAPGNHPTDVTSNNLLHSAYDRPDAAIKPGEAPLGRPGDAHQHPSIEPASFLKDPAQFLATLSDHFSQIAGKDTGLITREDLLKYINTADDHISRNAARIAVAHFDELNHLAKVPDAAHKGKDTHLVNGREVKGITAQDLNAALNLEAGNTSPYGNRFNRKALTAEIGTDLATVGLAAATALTVEIPPLSFALGAAAVGAFAGGMVGTNILSDDNSYAKAQARKEQSVFASWNEINGGNLPGNREERYPYGIY